MIDQITSLLGVDVSYALGWTIIHSLWQVSLLALIMSGVHKVHINKSSEFKYGVSLTSILLALVSSVITFVIYYSGDSTSAINADVMSTTLSHAGISESSISIIDSINNIFANNLHHINTVWVVGAVLFSLRFVMSYGYIKYIKSTATELLDPAVQKILASTKANIGINKVVRFVESSKINVPMVLGHSKPIILFPVGMVTMLTTQEIEAIIAHELFHIKRNDYIVNMVLTIIEIVYFFHPAMWWISANVKAERENCCDDAAISYNIDSVTYAKILVKLEEMRNVGIPSLAMPFASNEHQLLNRIKRILNMEQTKNDIKEKSVATILLLFVAMLFASNTNRQLSEVKSNEDPSHENFGISYTTNFSSKKESSDTMRLSGEDEIVVKLKNRVFSTLSIDGKEVKTGEIINKLKSDFVFETQLDENQNQVFQLQGNPTLIFDDQILRYSSDYAYFGGEDNENNTRGLDTIPQKKSLNNNSVTVSTDKNGKKIEVTKKNGKITKLKIDGKTIPENEYNKYQDDIDSAFGGIDFDMGDEFEGLEFEMKNLFDGKSMDSILSNSFGMMFDGEDWREFGGNIEQLLDEDVFEKLKNMENFRMFDMEEFEKLDGLKGLENLKGLEKLKNLERLEGLEGLEGLEDALEKMGIQLDSSMRMLNFDMDDFEGFDGFEFFSDDNMEIRDNDGTFGSSTVVDKLGNALNRDGLLQEYKSNKIELSGKHLKINGEKMPKALFNKYKNIYQEETGAPLTKKSKMVFDVEGKPSKRKVKSF